MSYPASTATPTAKTPQTVRPPYDTAYHVASGVGIDWEALRKYTNTSNIDTIRTAFPDILHQDVEVPSIKGLDDTTITLAILQSKTSRKVNRPAILFVHGGGQVIGNRFTGVENMIKLIPQFENVVLASVEYRLAPAHRAPAAAYDCYAAAVYLANHATELGIDASRILIYGVSGGAGPAAATCILARDRQYPPIRAQVLSIPMIDDRDHYPSHKQFESGTVWHGKMNQEAWDMILGSDRGSPNGIEVPGRVEDWSNLPPALINVGECEVFRDSAVALASRIWSQGGSCELHVWPGLYHAGMSMEPDVPVSRAGSAAERNYIERALGFKQDTSSQIRGVAQASL